MNKSAADANVYGNATGSVLVDSVLQRLGRNSGLLPSLHLTGATCEDLLLSEANNRHHMRLKAAILSSLRRNAHYRGEKRILRTAADLSYRKLILSRYFNAWNDRTTFLPSNLRFLFGAARAHHRIQLLRRCLRHWTGRVAHRRQVNMARETANKFFHEISYKRLLSQFFRTWLRSAQCAIKAEHFQNRKLLSFVLNNWVTVSRSLAEHHRMHRLAILHDIKATRIRWFTRWRGELSIHHINTTKLENFIRRRLLRCAFNTWHAHHIRSSEITQFLCERELRRREVLLRRIWSAWRSCMQHTQKGMEIAGRFHRQNELPSHRRILLSWARWTVVHRKQHVLIENNRKFCLLRKRQIMFFHWHALASSHTAARNRTNGCLQKTHDRLRILVLFGALNWWRTNFKLRQMMLKAETFNSHTVFRRVFSKWRKLSALGRRKIRMKSAADQFHAITLKMQYFHVWSAKHLELSRLHRLDALALCRWSLRLQARVWSAWRLWLICRGRERVRVEEALMRYQRRIASDTLREWTRAALEIRRRRQVTLCHKHWNDDFRSFRIAANAATRWYWRTRSKQIHSQSLTVAASEANPGSISFSANSTTNRCRKQTLIVSAPSERSCIDKFPNENPVDRLCSLSQPLCPRFILPYLHERGISIEHQRLSPSPHTLFGWSGNASACSVETVSPFTILNENIKVLEARSDCLRILKLQLRLERFVMRQNIFPSPSTEQYMNLQEQVAQEKLKCKRQLFHIISFIQNTFFTHATSLH